MTVTLRDRLAAKARRRVRHEIVVSDPSDEQLERVAALQAQALAGLADGSDPDTLVQRLLADAEAIRAESTASVWFAALDPDDFEAVAATYPSPEGDDGGMDWQAALPVLAAVCAEDESLRDDDWWREQLDSGRWSFGERLSLWAVLFELNTSSPRASTGKG